jgi:hypothetical protein
VLGVIWTSTLTFSLLHSFHRVMRNVSAPFPAICSGHGKNSTITRKNVEVHPMTRREFKETEAAEAEKAIASERKDRTEK